MDVDVAVAVEVAGRHRLLVGGGAQDGQRPGRRGRIVRHRQHGGARAAVVPGEDDLLAAAGRHLVDAHALQEVAARRRVGDVEVGEGAGAVVARPREILASDLTVGAEDVEVAVVVEIVDGGDVVERRADRLPRPGASQRARIRIPPAAGRQIRQAVAVEVAPVDEDRAPRQRGLDDVALPETQRQGRGLVLPHLDHRRVGRAVVPVGAEDVEVAVAADVADAHVVRSGHGHHLDAP